MCFQLVDFQEPYEDNDPDSFIHVAEMALSSNCRLHERPGSSSHRRHRLDAMRPCTTDESLVRNGH
jgi:hypothetical protein